MTPPDHNSADSLGGSPDEERLGALINDFFDRRRSGDPITPEEFLAAHPDDADELREHLGGLDLIASLGTSSAGERTMSAETIRPSEGSSSEDQLESKPAFLPEVSGYEILKSIGRGGMGVVFKAVQKSTKRVVALKLLLEGSLASDSARRRFEREIALAAQLNHPNIIPIYDSGVTEGRMFYAMEYIHGLALGDYLRAHSLDIPSRLRLFVKTCQAVSHAHQRGVVHRDIKPSNVLVDGACEPHILDFGLAKASVLLDTTTSVTAQIIGTPAYMSPEQTAGDPNSIDTRTDVYSLGVMLYEMLTGRMPYDTSSAIGTVLHNVAHAEPTPPGKVDSRIDGELSAIVLKALEKPKENRYQSVDAFCSDVERYLKGEPVTAKPASAFYLLRKMIRHNRLAAGVCVLFICFSAVTWGVAQYYSKKVERAQQQVRQLEDRFPGPPRSAGPRPDAAGDGKRSEEEVTRAQLESLLSNLDPEYVKRLGPMARDLQSSIDRGEDPRMAVARLVVGLAAQLEPEPGRPLPKNPTLEELTQPETTTKPGSPPAKSGESGAPLDARKLERAFRFLRQSLAAQPMPDASPTSQTATSEPAPGEPGASGGAPNS